MIDGNFKKLKRAIIIDYYKVLLLDVWSTISRLFSFFCLLNHLEHPSVADLHLVLSIL